MCGIAGILRICPAPTGLEKSDPPSGEVRIPDSWLDCMDNAIAHRGPDASGRYRDRISLDDGSFADLAFVHRRLAIIDPEGGAQPMSHGGQGFKGRVTTVFNGCIYNHHELRKELKAGKMRFESDHSDTEVILHGYRQWGQEIAQKLEGMFAFAIWDARHAELILCRDPAGEKPLYTAAFPDGSGHAFASTARALVDLLRAYATDAGSRDPIRPTGAIEWLATGTGRNTPLAGIHEVPPGTRVKLNVANGTPSLHARPFWTPPKERNPKPQLNPQMLDAALSETVACRLEADVPLGVLLSGGVDSSLIAAYAQKHLHKRGENLKTFTLRMPDDRYDESGFAEAIAQRLNTTHRTLFCETNPAEDLIHLIRTLGLPFGDSSLLPTYWLCKAARQHVKVVLTGDGADELFCGYERHLTAHALGSLRPLLRAVPTGKLGRKDPKSASSKLGRLANAAKKHGYHDLTAIFPSQDLEWLLGSQAALWLARPDAGVGVEDHPAYDFATYLPRDILRKCDTASMACGLELRSPFLDSTLIQACLSEPLSSLMPKGQRKGLLRTVARAHLPTEIADRPKMGFAIPIGDWFRTNYGNLGDLLKDTLASADPWPGLDVQIPDKQVKRMLNEHMQAKRDHSQRLYMLLVLSIWTQWLGEGGCAMAAAKSSNQDAA